MKLARRDMLAYLVALPAAASVPLPAPAASPYAKAGRRVVVVMTVSVEDAVHGAIEVVRTHIGAPSGEGACGPIHHATRLRRAIMAEIDEIRRDPGTRNETRGPGE